MLHGKTKVNAYMVHQESEADVLICDEYINLPSIFKKSVFELELKRRMSDIEYEKLLLLYEIYNDYTPKESIFKKGDYLLNSIIPVIPKSSINNLSDKLQIIIRNNYIEYENKLILNNEYLNYHDERSLLYHLGDKSLMNIEHGKLELIKFLSENNDLLKNKVYYVTMFNDTRHAYFYRKNHEHVPGMMIIEAVRQAFYAFTYTFKKAKRGSVSISMSTLNSEFYSYTQSNYPLRIQVEESVHHDDLPERHLRLRAKLYQRQTLVGEISYSGIIMELNLFNRLRKMGKDEENYTFYPIKAIDNTILLIDERSSSNILISKLKKISLKGMQVSIKEKGQYDLDIGHKFKFILDIKDDNKIISSCQVVEKIITDDGIDLSINYINLSKPLSVQLSDCIKNYTYINNEELII